MTTDNKPYVDRDWRMLRIHVHVLATAAFPFAPLVFTDHWKIALAVPFVLFIGFESYCRWQRRHVIYRLYGQAASVREMSEWLSEKVRDYFADPERRRPTSRAKQWWIQNITHGKLAMNGHGSRADREAPESVLIRTRNLRENGEDGIVSSMRSVRVGSQPGGPYVMTGAFRQSGMAVPSITREATEAVALACADLCMIGTGEGGLWPEHLAGGRDAQVEFQIGTGYFGCRAPDGTFDLDRLVRLVRANPSVVAIQIKLSQGAKQDGGKAPGWKITREVAEMRGIEAGKDCFSPQTHSAFHGAAGLAAFVRNIREATGRVVGVKFAVGSFEELDAMCAAWAADPTGMTDYVQVDGGEGGTGAAYEEMMKCGGMPASVAIQAANLLLKKHGIRERVTLVGSAGGFTPEDVLRLMALGSDIVATGRGFKYALGCIAAGKCHMAGSCPTGIASNGTVIDPKERAEWVRKYLNAVYQRSAHLLSLTGLDDYRKVVGTGVRYMAIKGVPIWTIGQVEDTIRIERGET